MENQDKKGAKKTQVSDIGRITLIENLLNMVDCSLSDSPSFGGEEGFTWINSHKLFLEGIDFDLTYMPLKYLGYKTVIFSLGPVFAKGYTPDHISVKIGLSKKYFKEDIEEIWLGMKAAIEEYKLKVNSLELLPSLTGLTISISAQGKQKNSTIVQREKCSSGDLICLTGNIGAAYMGLQLLEREKSVFKSTSAQPDLGNYKYILKSYLNPEINKSLIEEINQTGVIPSDGEFLEQGLASAIKMICYRYELGAKIFLDKLPIASETFRMAEEINIDATTAAINGGEDVQFIFIIPLSQYEKIQKELPQFDVIGHLCSPEIGTVLVTPDGLELELKAQGWSK